MAAGTFDAVLTINGNDYRLVLLDTNALSEFAKQGDSFRHFLTWSSAEPMFVPCFSLFSVLEMRRRPDVYGRFKELFRVWPCLLVKSHEQLLEDEVRRYPDPSRIDPTLLGFSMLGGEGMDLARVLDTASADEFFRGREKYWNDGAQDIVEGIASLVANFPPDGDTYRPDEVRHFVEMACFSQVAMRQLDFARQLVDLDNEAVSIGAFPSVKATTYAVWHKFYADRNRKWTRSDAFDIIIASAIPYVDAVVTESHLAESLRKDEAAGRLHRASDDPHAARLPTLRARGRAARSSTVVRASSATRCCAPSPAALRQRDRRGADEQLVCALTSSAHEKSLLKGLFCLQS